jgi:hypothetical protein
LAKEGYSLFSDLLDFADCAADTSGTDIAVAAILHFSFRAARGDPRVF